MVLAIFFPIVGICCFRAVVRVASPRQLLQLQSGGSIVVVSAAAIFPQRWFWDHVNTEALCVNGLVLSFSSAGWRSDASMGRGATDAEWLVGGAQDSQQQLPFPR